MKKIDVLIIVTYQAIGTVFSRLSCSHFITFVRSNTSTLWCETSSQSAIITCALALKPSRWMEISLWTIKVSSFVWHLILLSTWARYAVCTVGTRFSYNQPSFVNLGDFVLGFGQIFTGWKCNRPLHCYIFWSCIFSKKEVAEHVIRE